MICPETTLFVARLKMSGFRFLVLGRGEWGFGRELRGSLSGEGGFCPDGEDAGCDGNGKEMQIEIEMPVFLTH